MTYDQLMDALLELAPTVDADVPVVIDGLYLPDVQSITAVRFQDGRIVLMGDDPGRALEKLKHL